MQLEVVDVVRQSNSKPYRLLVLLACTLGLASCITPNLADWPRSIPTQEVFVEVYESDVENQELQSQTEYLEWTLSFYQGNLAYQSGWVDIEEYLIEAPSEEQDELLMGQLRDLGIAIGSEWSRHNDIRLIDTRMLSLWGSTIQLSEDYETQQESIETIAEDVELLLNGDLAKEDILDTRYDELLGLDGFSGF
ncbi:MAG: hypothetical protein DHS20C12_27960 [Pseudohongiella sp.]|nr:MAG: hypothetical protein DHS20C12_27960 [Pseudohongiella sp.]